MSIRYTMTAEPEVEGAWRVIDTHEGVAVLVEESYAFCAAVCSHLNGAYTDDLSEAYEVAQSIARKAGAR